MRTLLLVPIVAAACGSSNPDSPPLTADAGTPPSCPPPAAAPCTTQVAIAALPTWFLNDGFVLAPDPADNTKTAWVSESPALPVTTSFVVPFHDGDRITGLTIDAYGSGAHGGIQGIQLLYKCSPTSGTQILATGDDESRKAEWGQITLSNVKPTGLSEAGLLWIQLTVDENRYYIGNVTPTLERPCK